MSSGYTMIPNINAHLPQMMVHEQQTGAKYTQISYQEDRQLCDLIKTSNWDVVESFLHSEHIAVQNKVKLISYKDEIWGRNALLNAIENDAPLSIVKCIIELRGSDTEAVLQSVDRNGNNALHTCCKSKSSWFDVLPYIVEKMEGRSILKVNNDGDTCLHLACRNNFLPLSEIKFIVEVILRQEDSGRAVLIETNCKGDNVLHCACSRNNSSLNLLRHMYKVMKSIDGEEHVLFEANDEGNSPLHLALIHSDAPLDVIKFIVDMMQKRSESRAAIIKRNHNGDSLFHLAVRYNSSFEVVTYITAIMEMQLGGKEVFFKINHKGHSAFHLCCENRKITLKVLGFVIDLMQEHPGAGMRAMFSTDKDGRYKFLDLLVPNNDRKKKVEMCHFVLSRCNKMSQDVVSKLPPKTRDLILKIPQRIDESLIYEKLMKRLMNAKFIYGAALPILMMDMYVQVALIVLFSFVIVPGKTEQPYKLLLITLLSPCTLWLILCEVTEVLKAGKLYIAEIYNIIDVAQIIVVLMTIRNLCDGKLESSSEQTTLLVATSIVWTRILFVLGNFFYSIAVFNTALLKILAELVPFLVTTITVVLAFAHMFHFTGYERDSLCTDWKNKTSNFTQDEFLAFFDEGGWTCTWYNSYVTTFHMLLSGEWHFLNDFPPTRQSVVAMVYAFVIGIILLNMIIAVISIAFHGVSENIDQAFWSQRYRFLIGDVLSMSSMCGRWVKEDLQENADTLQSNDRHSIRRRRRALLLDPISLNPISRIHYIRNNFLERDIDNLDPLKWSVYFFLRAISLLILAATTPCFFVAGALTFGYLWSNDIKVALLFGPTTRRIEATLSGIDKFIEKEKSILKADISLLSTKFEELCEQNAQLIEDNRQLKKDSKEMKKEFTEMRSMLEFLIESTKRESIK